MNVSIGAEKTMGAPEGAGGAEYALRAGEVLGPYRIVRPLGRGGMGEVYLVEHERLRTRHALKIIRPDWAGVRGFEERFFREANLMARLKHPNIVRCEGGGVDRGLPWLAMEYIEGPRGEPMDLQAFFDERREQGKLLAESEAVAVGLQICEALACAHTYRDDEIPAGIIHRDLKPSNILIGDDTRLYVTDFGLARLIGRDFEQSLIRRSMAQAESLGDGRTVGAGSQKTTDRVGTFDYMSPEQREGNEADARSDVYALGAVLYELLTGRKVAGVPRRPTKVRPELQPVWDEIIYERCLAAEPEDRYGSAADLKVAILRATGEAGDDVASPPARLGLRDDVRPAKGRMPAGVWIASIVAMSAILASAAVWWLKPPGWATREGPSSDAGMSAPSGPVATAESDGSAGTDTVATRSTADVGVGGAMEVSDRKAGDALTVDLGGGVTMDLCWIPPGEFTMGSPPDEMGRREDESQCRVTITRGFWMGRCEVTQRQYQQLMGDNPSRYRNAGSDMPVEQVDWDAARTFCDELPAGLATSAFATAAADEGSRPVCRLPTEAEWEYACRAGTTTALNHGMPLTSAEGRCVHLDDVAWYAENGGWTTHPVGERRPNAWGLYDMHGNVAEWCGDWYGAYPTGMVTAPSGPSSGLFRVTRGGSWGSPAGGCRSAARCGNDPSYRNNDLLGFRIVVVR